MSEFHLSSFPFLFCWYGRSHRALWNPFGKSKRRSQRTIRNVTLLLTAGLDASMQWAPTSPRTEKQKYPRAEVGANRGSCYHTPARRCSTCRSAGQEGQVTTCLLLRCYNATIFSRQLGHKRACGGGTVKILKIHGCILLVEVCTVLPRM